jgi:hypothetical protein
MFLLLQPKRVPSNKNKKSKLSLHTSNLCQIRTSLVLERQMEFCIQLRDCMAKYDTLLDEFFIRKNALL